MNNYEKEDNKDKLTLINVYDLYSVTIFGSNL